MIKKIAHLADIHIRRSTDRHVEYREVFGNLYNSLKEDKPDRIVIVGDLYHDYIEFQGEAMSMAGNFLLELSKIAPTIITRGNHDIRKKNLNRQDFIKTVVGLLDNDRIIYYDKTGVYEDENVSWCVWNHPDKEKFDTSKSVGTKIDLFHDPIYSSISVNGYRMDKEHYVKIDSFSGEYGFFGDIHQRQFFSNGKRAYCGSLIQQNYEESLKSHGYLLWDIENDNVLERDIHNNYGYHVINIDENIDFDNIFINENMSKFPRIKVKWVGNKSDINKINEIKIRKALQLFNPIEIKIEKEYINIDITDTKTQIDNIDDTHIQQEIFKEYLSLQKYSDVQIEEILKIDNEVNTFLDLKDYKSYNWSLEKIWIDNFKSYGDNIILNIDELKGLLQITGINTQGKTTILDSICYLLFGKTLSTTKKEKHGDSRFLNNKRDLTYCRVGGILNVNGKQIKIVRRTDVSCNKKNQINQCTTSITVYKTDNDDFFNLKPDDELTGEQLKDTQKLLSEIFGTFEDFIRSVLTNADNLNELLSIDRSTFIDSVNRDAGLDIFEKKLSAYKDWKKNYDQKNDRININVLESQESIKIFKESILYNENLLNHNITNKKSIKDEIEKLQNFKLDLAKKIIPIEDELSKLSKISLKEDISNYEKEIFKKKLEIDDIEKSIKNIKPFDTSTLSDNADKINKMNDEISKFHQEWQKINLNIKEFEKSILEFENKKINFYNECKNLLFTKIKNLESKNDVLSESSNSDKKMAVLLKEEMSSLENSKTCITCGREVGLEDKKNIVEKIEEIQKKLNILKEEYQERLIIIENNKIEINNIKDKISKIDSNLDVEQMSIIEKISSDINDTTSKISNLKIESEQITDNAKKSKLVLKKLQEEQIQLQEEQQLYVNSLKMSQKSKDLLLECETLNNKISEKEHKIILLDKLSKDIENNENIQRDINKINFQIEKLESDMIEIESEIQNLNIKINELYSDISILEKNIEAYLKQLERDKIHKAYMDCVHRDGIPTMLLKKMIGRINEELSNMLQGQDFISYFDESLNLKMSHMSKLESSQNVIESSGKERTFIALALKMSLRLINRRTKPNFIMFDEIMGKLIDSSIDEFMVLLDRIVQKIDHVFIIEHNHNVNFDHQIEVVKNEEGVSNLFVMS